ncbi:unnamed protein product [Trifolium pratense]|nr:unnamed protein product [Trifolium pratense]
MENNNAKKPVAGSAPPQRRKKRGEVSTSNSTRSRRSKDVKKVEVIVLSSDTSDSGSGDEDYVSFLETYVPPELRASSSSEEEGSRVTVESKMTFPEPAPKDSESE